MLPIPLILMMSLLIFMLPLLIIVQNTPYAKQKSARICGIVYAVIAVPLISTVLANKMMAPTDASPELSFLFLLIWSLTRCRIYHGNYFSHSKSTRIEKKQQSLRKRLLLFIVSPLVVKQSHMYNLAVVNKLAPHLMHLRSLGEYRALIRLRHDKHVAVLL